MSCTGCSCLGFKVSSIVCSLLHHGGPAQSWGAFHKRQVFTSLPVTTSQFGSKVTCTLWSPQPQPSCCIGSSSNQPKGWWISVSGKGCSQAGWPCTFWAWAWLLDQGLHFPVVLFWKQFCLSFNLQRLGMQQAAVYIQPTSWSQVISNMCMSLCSPFPTCNSLLERCMDYVCTVPQQWISIEMFAHNDISHSSAFISIALYRAVQPTARFVWPRVAVEPLDECTISAITTLPPITAHAFPHTSFRYEVCINIWSGHGFFASGKLMQQEKSSRRSSLLGLRLTFASTPNCFTCISFPHIEGHWSHLQFLHPLSDHISHQWFAALMHGQVQGTKVERSLFFLTCSLHPFPMPQVRSLCWAHAIPHKPESPQCTVSNTDLHKACNIRNNFANPPRPSGECLFLIFHCTGTDFVPS